jgi:serine/threonine protein kinase
MNQAEIERRIQELRGYATSHPLEIITDTTEFMNIWGGHVLHLGDRFFLVVADMREGRFGMDEQPKFWVKKALDLESGEEKILKLVFHEEFSIRIGLLRIHCYRDPIKESELLELVRGDDRFMQGQTIEDERGNPIRILDFIRGNSLYHHLKDLPLDHYEYFCTVLPGVLRRIVDTFHAIAMIHERGYFHGDIRNDHILVDSETNAFRWIDFDLCQEISDFDVWSLGNVLLYVVGKGEHTFHDAAAGRISVAPGASLTKQDASAFFAHRIMNLAKLFPWIPRELNQILMRFSFGTQVFYESTKALLDDLGPVVESLEHQALGS